MEDLLTREYNREGQRRGHVVTQPLISVTSSRYQVAASVEDDTRLGNYSRPAPKDTLISVELAEQLPYLSSLHRESRLVSGGSHLVRTRAVTLLLRLTRASFFSDR